MLYLYLIIIRQRDRNLLCLGDSIIHLIQTEHYMLTVDMVKGCQCFTSVMQQRRAMYPPLHRPLSLDSLGLAHSSLQWTHSR